MLRNRVVNTAKQFHCLYACSYKCLFHYRKLRHMHRLILDYSSEPHEFIHKLLSCTETRMVCRTTWTTASAPSTQTSSTPTRISTVTPLLVRPAFVNSPNLHNHTSPHPPTACISSESSIVRCLTVDQAVVGMNPTNGRN